MSSTPRLLSLRRLIHKELTVNGLQKYWPLHEDESRILIEKVLLDPWRLLDYIRQYVFFVFGSAPHLETVIRAPLSFALHTDIRQRLKTTNISGLPKKSSPRFPTQPNPARGL
jgi:hypothetical protein